MRTYKKYGYCMCVVCLLFIFFACSKNTGKYKYYSVKENYVSATGRISHIKYNESGDALYLAFEDLDVEFSDNNFKINGGNLELIKARGIDDKIEIGKEVEFISATRYFGDGYVMPIVGISIDGQVFLEFDEGYSNLIKLLE